MSFESQLNIQAKVLGYSGYNDLDSATKLKVYTAYLANERNHQLQRIADQLEKGEAL